MNRPEHWNSVYARKAPNDVSWFQPEATLSLELIKAGCVPKTGAIIDVGAGASTLVDGLLSLGYVDITLLDIAESALSMTRTRLGDAPIRYEAADITVWQPTRRYDVWHDRAVFHFLTSAADRTAYRDVLARAVSAGGQVVIAAFAEDGPERCSGLPVQRYSSGALASEFSSILKPLETRTEQHLTPGGVEQSFVFTRFERF